MASTEDPRRHLPSVDALLGHERVAAAAAGISPEFIVVVARRVLADVRSRTAEDGTAPDLNAIVTELIRQIRVLQRPSPRRVINATGVVLHTGLGRAPLSTAALDAVINAAGYCDLEFDLAAGDRGDRQSHLEQLLCLLTGASAALVVNNNAAALFLTLNTLAQRREVVVSRGELIEIGGSFRLPDIMLRSGAKLVEVGSTNRTRLEDYRDVIGGKTAMLLRAHPSNYRIEGFTESVALDELVGLGHTHGIPVVEDLGNGLLWDWSDLGLPAEENVRKCLADGADLVLVSGDKVLGGPQSGIILGKADYIARLKKNPLNRVVRPDKMTIAALAATLHGYLNRLLVPDNVPVWSMLAASVETLRERAVRLQSRCLPLASWRVLEICDAVAEAGSGTLPAVALPGLALCAVPKGWTTAAWARQLRKTDIPVIATVKQDLLYLHMRTLSERDEDALIGSLTEALREGNRA